MKIVFLDRYSVGDSDLAEIAALGQYVEYEDSTQAQVVERAADADVIITNKVLVMQPQIDALPNLKLICVAATGVNNVDVQYAANKGVMVKNVPAYSTQSVAEATFAMVLALMRSVVYYDTYVKSGDYAASGRCFNLDMPINQIDSKRWGVIGMGNIGRKVAQIATAFGAEVVYFSTSGKNSSQPYPALSLDELLSSCDIVSLHAPLNENTRNLLSYNELQLMKRSAVLVNMGRGGIVVEADLARALNEGVIAGAGIDTWENEPVQDGNMLLKINDLNKIVVAPHSAWSSAEARRVLVATIAKNIRETLT